MPAQDQVELDSLLKILEDLSPRIVLEIGVFQGGMERVVYDRCGGDLFVGIERNSLDSVESKKNLHGVPFVAVPFDSHEQSTLDKVKSTLDGKLVDFLFIDGDHTFKGVSKDFEMYAPLVREGGMIGFHDINDNKKYLNSINVFDVECHEFWKSIEGKYQTKVISNGGYLGIGLIMDWKGFK